MPIPTPSINRQLLSLLDENRLLILREIFACPDPLCGCDLVERLEIPKNLLSYHVKTLREAGFVEETRCGRKKQYRLAPTQEPKVHQLLQLFELIK